MMKKPTRSIVLSVLVVLFVLILAGTAGAETPKFRVLAFYSVEVEKAHVEFALDAIRFFNEMARTEGFVFDTTSLMSDLNEAKLKRYQLVVWLNDFPHTPDERAAFEKYMAGGGAWFGFHVAAYNDKTTDWPWFVDFLGGGVFWRNNWPPLPARLIVDDQKHPVTARIPASFMSPSNEWYQWQPSPRLSDHIKVLVTLSPENYPLGVKDILPDGDLPVVWMNTRYQMLYMNMGHGNLIFSDPIQNRLITDGVLYFKKLLSELGPK
ncbi:MAG: ThuA domain-containing protein [Phycisphaerales bacterium]